VKQNLGDADRTIRIMAGTLIGVTFFALPQGTLSLIFGIVCIILLVSSLTGWSFLYFVFRISTRSVKDTKPLEPS
jgi:hypothetical protein